MEVLKLNDIPERNKVLILSSSSRQSQEEQFREVCSDLNVESVFLKGKMKKRVNPIKPDEKILAIVIFQRRDPGKNLDIISDIKVNFRRLPIIFYSTKYSADIETLIRRTGIHYFLTPGFAKEELALVLEALIEQKKDSTREKTI